MRAMYSEDAMTARPLPVVTEEARSLYVHRTASALRAAEVALSGRHRIGFLSVGARDDAESLVADVNAAGGDALLLLPCPCGNFNSPTRLCECSVRRARGWTRKPNVRASIISCRMIVDVLPSEIVQYAPEPWERVMERVAAARPEVERAQSVNATVDGPTLRLIEAWRDRMHPPTRVFQDMQHVMRTIAAMDGAYRDTELAVIEPQHAAEAVMYVISELARRTWQ
jgi:hypothetical protein